MCIAICPAEPSRSSLQRNRACPPFITPNYGFNSQAARLIITLELTLLMTTKVATRISPPYEQSAQTVYEKDEELLVDLLSYAKLAVRRARGRSQDELIMDKDLQSLLIHPLLVIGEAAKNLSVEFR